MIQKYVARAALGILGSSPRLTSTEYSPPGFSRYERKGLRLTSSLVALRAPPKRQTRRSLSRVSAKRQAPVLALPRVNVGLVVRRYVDPRVMTCTGERNRPCLLDGIASARFWTDLAPSGLCETHTRTQREREGKKKKKKTRNKGRK